jgi:hypothetical protein
MGQMEKFLPPFPSPAHQQLYPSRPAGGNQRDKQPFNNTCTQAPNKPHFMHASAQQASLHAGKRPTSLTACTQASNKPHCMHASVQQASLHARKRPAILTACTQSPSHLIACTRAPSYPYCMYNKRTASLTACTTSACPPSR